MEFRTLDVRRSPEEQGFQPYSYDMIIASNVLHATPNLEETMHNVRTLLKPGGQLIVLELTCNRHSRIGFIFGLFADWWAGADEGRVTEPYVSMDRWDSILKRSGFSGVDSRFEYEEGHIFPTSVFRSKAVNEKVSRLFQPLSAPPIKLNPPIVTIGGVSAKTQKILDDMQKKLTDHQFRSVKRIEDVSKLTIEPGSTFLILSELDDDVFSKMNRDTFEALKRLCSLAKYMLWVTENAWVEHPFQAMTHGLLRSLRLEYVDTHIQVVDLDSTAELDTNFLSECLLRLEWGSDWQDTGILWSAEPEIFISQGRALIPRLVPDRSKNNRLNSRRRGILADVDPAVSSILLHHNGDNTYLQYNETYAPDKGRSSPSITIRVHHSLGRAVRVGNLGYFNITQGAVVDQGHIVVALSKENGSLVEVSPDLVVPLSKSCCFEAGALLSIASDLVAQTLLAGTAAGENVFIYMAPQIYVRSIARRARAEGIHVTFASIQPPSDIYGQSWVQLQGRETQRELAKKLPPKVRAFYNFSVDRSPVGMAQALSRYLAQKCPTFQPEDLIHSEASIWTEEADAAAQMLREAVKEMSDYSVEYEAPTTPVQELITLGRTPDFSTVLNWKTQNVVSARVQPINSGGLFSQDKTYLLIGLTGDLGRSICRWMIEHGAKHVVLSSRNPQIDPRWIDEMVKLGGNIIVLPM